MQDNNLEAFCADFPTSGDLCIVHGCKTYTVQANDSCKSIAKSHRLTQTQVFTCECFDAFPFTIILRAVNLTAEKQGTLFWEVVAVT